MRAREISMTQTHTISPALSSEALFSKSKIQIDRGLSAKNDGNDEEFQLWGALALEVLAKASLSKIHPSLVVEPENINSLLEASGIRAGTAVRTIGAQAVYARLKHTVPNFRTPIFEECKKLAERRNSELHSGEAAFASFPPNYWEPNFWHAAELILSSMGMELEDWLGVNAEAPKSLLASVRDAKRQAAVERIKDYATTFRTRADGKKRGAAEQKRLREKSDNLDPNAFDDKFRYMLNQFWLGDCPACHSQGAVGGDRIFEELADDQDAADAGYEIVEIAYAPIEFYCPTCGLSLTGDEALGAGSLLEEYIEFDEREIEYEPDYGND
jgi:hypothetical protein